MSEYVLPDLDYDYAALEPHISGRIMELHHSKHQATYVKGANDALAQLAEARAKGEFGTIPKLSKDLAFHVGGVINHSIFWKNMSPEGGDKPEGELAAALDDAFGSFDAFKAHFTATAMGVRGCYRVPQISQLMPCFAGVYDEPRTTRSSSSHWRCCDSTSCPCWPCFRQDPVPPVALGDARADGVCRP